MKVEAIGFLQFAYLFSIKLMQLVGMFLACSSPLFYFLLEKNTAVSCFNKLSTCKGQEMTNFRCGFESEGDTAMKSVDWDFCALVQTTA